MQHCSLNSIYESNISHLGIFWLEMSYILKFQQFLGKKHNQMSELYISVQIVRENMLISRGIYTAGKKITLPPAVTAVTNLTSVSVLAKEHGYEYAKIDIDNTVEIAHLDDL